MQWEEHSIFYVAIFPKVDKRNGIIRAYHENTNSGHPNCPVLFKNDNVKKDQERLGNLSD